MDVNMPPFDPHCDPQHLLSVHDRLALALRSSRHPTTEELQNANSTSILSCPAEILDSIFQYISANHDLAQLCKVNKRFFATALPWLYKDIHTVLKPRLTSPIIQMLTRENTGLRFVRNVFAHAGKDDTPDKLLLQQCLLFLVNHLPMNKLRGFYWLDTAPLPSNVVTTLWERQRNSLIFLEILPESKPTLRDGTNHYQRQLERLTFPKLYAVRAVLKTVACAKAACAALQSGRVIDLEVDALHWTGGDAYEFNFNAATEAADVDSNDPSIPTPEFPVKDLLTRTLFGHLRRFKPGCTSTFDSLTTLQLKDINLTLSRHTWFTYLDLKNLKFLDIAYCKGADKFLLILASSFPALEFLGLVHHLGNQSDCTIHAIEELLIYMPVNKLRTLKLCLRNADSLPSIAPILKHRDSLQKLLLDVSKNKLRAPSWDPLAPPPPQENRALGPYLYHSYEENDFELFIKSCTQLRELGIALPRYGLYFTDLPSMRDGYDEFNRYINTLARHLRLSTLNIVNWPEKYKYGKLRRYYLGKNASLARLAAAIFKRHKSYHRELDHFCNKERKASLEIISFGVEERVSGTLSAPRAVHFLECEGNTLGTKDVLAKAVSIQELNKHALDTDIIDYGCRDFDKASRKKPSASFDEDDVSDDDASQASQE